MKNFKEMLDKDLDRTFYNTGEFAQVKRIRFDGIDKEIPVIYDTDEMKERKTLTSGDNAEGIYKVDVVVRLRLSDLERVPRNGMRFWIGSELFKITDILNEYNELIIDLVRFDE